MRTITAMVRNGRVETDAPIKLPEGTRLRIVLEDASEAREQGEDAWDDTPASVEAWIAELRALEPFILTEDDRRRMAEARAAQRAFDLEHADARAEKLRRLWE